MEKLNTEFAENTEGTEKRVRCAWAEGKCSSAAHSCFWANFQRVAL
jgi:hypothetical protein